MTDRPVCGGSDVVPIDEDSQHKIIELSELAGGLAHEIRNPLSTLKVNLQLLAEDLQEGQPEAAIDSNLRRRALQRLETLQSEADRLGQLLDDFLKLVGRQDLSAAPLDLNSVVQHLVDFITPRVQQQGIQLRVSLCPGRLRCLLDRALIQQALLNLCLNAQQAMPHGGELMIQTSADGAWADVDITDTGMGMAPDLLERVFKPFFSTRRGGTGLGLSLTRRIIVEHGGEIAVQSEPGKGSRFRVRLPRVDAGPSASPASG